MAKGAGWLVLARLTERSIGFVSTLLLARLLVPEDFGLVAMAISILAMLEVMSAFNFDIALIQTPDATRQHYDTAWTFNVMFGFANGLIMVALSLPAAIFYHDSRVTGIMMALAVNCAVRGLGNIGVVTFDRELKLHKEFGLVIAKKVMGFAVTIALAFSLRSYWALIGGTLASSVAGVALSYAMHPFRPKFSLKAHSVLLRFSKWMLLNNLLNAIVHRLPELVIGKAGGAATLGAYTVAYEISNLPTTELVFPISRAVFPGYSRMAQDRDALRRGFVDVLAVILLVCVPAGVGILVLAEPFVHVLLGARWVEAIPLIQVLAAFGIVRASASNTGAVYLALGAPRLLTYMTILYLVILIPALCWLVPAYGALGAAFAALLTVSMQVPVGFALVMKQIGLSFSCLWAVMWRPLSAGLLMGVSVVRVRSGYATGTNQGDYLIQLFSFTLLGAVVYVAAVIALWSVSGRPRGGEVALFQVARLALNKLGVNASK